MNILVTGASGFVGRLLVAELLSTRKGDSISVLLLPAESVPPSFEGRVDVLRGDLRDAAAITAAVAGKDLVFHLAAFISYWRYDAGIMDAVNRGGVANMVDACVAAGVKRLVHVSSVGAIGYHPDGSPSDESVQFNWPEDFGYMTTKRDGQKIVMDAVRDRGLDAVIVNPASIMGPGDPVAGTAHNRLYGNMYRQPFFFGTFAGGLAVVDVRDLVAVILAAAEKGRKGESYLAVGANVPYSRVLEIMAKSAGKTYIPFAIPPAILTAAGWLAEVFSGLTKKRPLITASYGRLSGWVAYYSNEKSRAELCTTYRPLEETIDDACAYYEARFLGRPPRKPWLQTL